MNLKDLFNLSSANTELEGKIKTAQAEIDRLTAENTSRQAELSKAAGELKAANDAKALVEKELQALRDELPAKISAGVTDKLSALGVKPSDLPAPSIQEPGEKKNLKGRALAEASIRVA